MPAGGSGRLANFRTNFVGRMVGDSAESSRFQLEEQILTEDADVDLTKLAQFAVKHQLPHAHRVAIWKLLLKVTSCFPEARKMIAEHRTQEAEILLKSLSVMRMTSSWSSSNARDSGEVQPSDVDIVRMIQLGEGRLPSSKDKHCWDLHSQAQLAIAKQMLILCETEWLDAFWLTKFFDALLASVFTDDVLYKVVDDVIERLRATHGEMAEAFDSSGMWTRLPFRFWLRSAAASLFTHEPLLRLWDKICGCTAEGVVTLLRTILISFLAEVGPHIATNQKAKEKSPMEVRLTVDMENAIITRSIENLSGSGKFIARKCD